MAGTDRILALRAKRGDGDAFEELVQRYQQLAFRVAYLITGEAQDAEDAMQEAFLKAYYNLPQFRPGALFKPWLLRIVTNEARNRKRAGDRYANLILRASEDLPEPAQLPLPESIVLSTEQHEGVLRALDSLPEDDRIVLSYRYFLDLSTREIAAALSCPPSTVRSRLSRALRRFQRQLEGSEEQRRSSEESDLKEIQNG